MLRIPALAIAGVLAIGGLTTVADAAPRGGHPHHGSHVSGHARSFGAPHRAFVARGVRVNRGYGVYGGRGFYRRHAFVRGSGFYRPYYYGAYASCVHWRQVLTPWGVQLRRVNVCRPWSWRHRYYS